jgi:probable F420-dependent oxidoreductase
LNTTRPELGFYVLAGQPTTSRAALDEVRDAERLGLGTAFISERYNLKEAGVLCGATGAVTDRIRIQTAATNHNTRHPMVTAGFARTAQSLTGGRFVLGLGRGVRLMQDAYGMSHVTTAQMEDFAGLMRRLFRGEAIVGHDGPAGAWPVLHLDSSLDEHLPMSIVAFGPETLKLAGRCFDEVVLHTYFTDETTRRCVGTVKEAAEAAGRDPDTITFCVAAPAYVGTDRDHMREQCRWFGGMVGNHVADIVSRYGDTGAIPQVLTDYIKGREGYDYNEHGRAGNVHTAFVPDEIVDRFCILGTPDDHVAKLNELKAIGADQFAVYLQHDNKEETLRAYGELIMPQLREHVTATS